MWTYGASDTLPDCYRTALINLMTFQNIPAASQRPRTCASHHSPRRFYDCQRRWWRISAAPTVHETCLPVPVSMSMPASKNWARIQTTPTGPRSMSAYTKRR